MKFLSLQGLCYFKDKIINYIEKHMVKFNYGRNVDIGINNYSRGTHSYLEGSLNVTDKYGCHVEGYKNEVHEDYSHVEGDSNIVNGKFQHAQGYFNAPVTEKGAFMHGCGVSSENRKNAFLIMDDKVYILGVNGFDGTNPTDTNDIATYFNSLK